jgi:hypothetical protein
MLQIANSMLSRIAKLLLRQKSQETPTPSKCWEEANLRNYSSLFRLPQTAGFETTRLRTKARQEKQRALNKR